MYLIHLFHDGRLWAREVRHLSEKGQTHSTYVQLLLYHMQATTRRRFGSKVWTVIFTYRWPAIRVISVRRARKAEEETYERKHSEDSGGV